MANKLGKDGLLTDEAQRELDRGLIEDPLYMNEPDDSVASDYWRRVFLAAQRDAMLDALDAMPPPLYLDTSNSCTGTQDCPVCAVLADRKAFRKRVLGG